MNNKKNNNMKKIAKLMTLALSVFVLASCEDVPSPYGTVTPPVKPSEVLPTGDGTASNPFNVTAAVAKCTEIGSTDSTEKYYVTGVVVTAGTADAQYGNATFVISDEGSSAKFTCFQVLGSDGKKMTAGFMFNVGDVVVVYGPMYNYKGNTPETAGKGAAYVVTVNGERTDKGDTPSGEAKGTGTLEDPFNAVAATNEALKLASGVVSEKAYYIKGKVSEIAVDKNGNVQNYDYGTYGNASFYVSDDGTKTGQFYCYRVLYLGNKKWTEGAGDPLKVGDDVIVCAKLTNYNGTPETQQNEGYLYSLNGKTEGGGGGGEVTPDQPKGNGTEGNPFNVAAAVAKCAETGETPTTESYYIKGIADEDYTIGSYKNLEVNIVDKEGCAQKFKVFRVKDKDGKDLKNGWKIAKGSTIIVYGPVVNYKGNTPETATGAYLVSVNGEAPQLDDGTGGGGSGGGDTGSADITAAFGDLDCSDITSIKLSDGTTLSLAQEDGSNAPVYHASSKALRIYARNSLTINAGSKKIDKVELAYDTYNGTAYKGNDEMYGEAGSNKLTPTKDDKNVTFTGVNNSTLKVVNWREEGTTGGTQLRLTGISITYAK